jgi:glycosyltransferase involved in cell wall biosynthesis
MKVCLIAPDPRTFVSGGNIYNRNLLRACNRLFDIERMDLGEYFNRNRKKTIAIFDSIYVNEIAEQGFVIPPGSLLLIHYLPVFSDKNPTEQKIHAAEKILKRFAGWIVTGAYTRKWLQTHIQRPRPIALILPAIARIKKEILAPPPPYRVLVAGNLIPVKGLIPLLRALEKEKPRQLQITLAGDDRLDPAYAGRLHEMVNRSSYLSKHIQFHKAAGRNNYPKLLGRSHLLISASRFETFGMAVHEALYNGVPVWALPSGNIAQIQHPLLHTFGSLTTLVASLKRISNKLPEPGTIANTEKQYGWKDAAKILQAFLDTDYRIES